MTTNASAFGASEPHGFLSDDTTADMERRQVDLWRRMSSVQKANLISQISRVARQLSVAGIRQRFPHASDREVFLHFAILSMGLDIARVVYPDVSQLIPPGT